MGERMIGIHAALTVALVVGVATAQETKTYEAPDGVSVQFPAGWALNEFEDKGRLRLLGRDGIEVIVESKQTGVSALSFAHFAKKNGESFAVQTKPAVMWIKRTDTLVEATLFRSLDARMFILFGRCTAGDWSKVQPALVASLASITLSKPLRPAPQGTKRSEKDGWTWFVEPGVAGKDLASVRKTVKNARKEFEKFHGRVASTPGRAVQILLCKTLQSARNLDPNAGRDKYGARFNPANLRLYLSVFPEDQEGMWRASCTVSVARALFELQYGAAAPRWVTAGEDYVADSVVRTGKRLPFMTQYAASSLPGMPHSLAALWDIERGKGLREDSFAHARAYAFFFRAGPPKYRKAYKAFLAELRQTHNPPVAMKSLLELDQTKLQEDVTRWCLKAPKIVASK